VLGHIEKGYFYRANLEGIGKHQQMKMLEQPSDIFKIVNEI